MYLPTFLLSCPPTGHSQCSTQNDCFTNNSDHFTPLFKSLQWFPISERKPMSLHWPTRPQMICLLFYPSNHLSFDCNPNSLHFSHPNISSLCLWPPSWNDPAKVPKRIIPLASSRNDCGLPGYLHKMSSFLHASHSLAPLICFSVLHDTHQYLLISCLFITCLLALTCIKTIAPWQWEFMALSSVYDT